MFSLADRRSDAPENAAEIGCSGADQKNQRIRARQDKRGRHGFLRKPCLHIRLRRHALARERAGGDGKSLRTKAKAVVFYDGVRPSTRGVISWGRPTMTLNRSSGALALRENHLRSSSHACCGRRPKRVPSPAGV